MEHSKVRMLSSTLTAPVRAMVPLVTTRRPACAALMLPRGGSNPCGSPARHGLLDFELPPPLPPMKELMRHFSLLVLLEGVRLMPCIMASDGQMYRCWPDRILFCHGRCLSPPPPPIKLPTRAYHPTPPVSHRNSLPIILRSDCQWDVGHAASYWLRNS